MKKVIISRVLIATLLTSSIVTTIGPLKTVSQQANVSAVPVQTSTQPQGLLLTTIDGITIPEDILIAVQLNFQGYAVIAAGKTRIGGQQLYWLRAETGTNNKPSLQLLFDANWKYISQKTVAPVSRKAKEPKPAEPQPAPQPAPETDRNEEQNVKPDDNKPDTGTNSDDQEEEPGPRRPRTDN